MRLVVYLALQRLIGSEVRTNYREFLSLAEQSAAEILRLQSERLQGLLHHAVKNIPYYCDAADRGKNLDLSSFPILTKDRLRGNFRSLMTGKLAREYGGPRSPGYSWIEVKTGGTTGVPVAVIHDKRFRDFGRASRMYSQYLCGFPFGVPYLRLWGSMREISRMHDSIPQRVARFLAAETLLNAFRMSEEQMQRYLEVMNMTKARHMMAYVDCAVQLANFAKGNGISVRPFDSLMACAGTVTPGVRSLLGETFGCRVHNKYGSRDCGDIACECNQGGLHIYANQVFLEVVDQKGKHLPAGQPGRILVTLLNSYSFPLIRYEIGDVGVLTSASCECGNPLPLLERVEGRVTEFLKTQSGAYISPVFIRHIVGVVHNPGVVRRFQFAQKSLTDYDLDLEIDEGVPGSVYDAVVKGLRRDLGTVLGRDARLNTRRVPRILEAESGKFQYVTTKVK